MTDCYICSILSCFSLLSPILSLPIVKLFFKASLMASPPFSAIPQLKISSSKIVLLLASKSAMAIAPWSSNLQFRRKRKRRNLFWSSDWQSIWIWGPSTLQSAILISSIFVLQMNIFCRTWKLSGPKSFSEISKYSNLSVYDNAKLKCSSPRLS